MELDRVDRTAGNAGNAGTRRRSWRGLGAGFAVVTMMLVSGCRADAVPSAPVGATGTMARQTIERVLDAQSAALLSGDEATYLADIDPTRPDTVARYRELFTNLQALDVTGWEQTVSGVDGEAALTVPADPVEVTVGYCLGIPDCPPTLFGAAGNARVTQRVSFAVVADRVVITDLLPPGRPATGRVEPIASDRGVSALPWQLSALVVERGARTVVATTPDLRDRLPAVLAAAESAAEVANQFAYWVKAPRYYVYLAGADEWTTWYSEPSRGSDVAQTITTSSRSMDIVVNAAEVPDRAMGSVLRHEMGHVTTMLGVNRLLVRDDIIGSQWVSEGMAELVRYADEPPSAVDSALTSLQSYLRTVASIETFLDAGWPADSVGASAFSTASYLAIRYLHAKYGADPLFEFVARVVRVPVPVSKASVDIFAEQWPDLEAEIWFAIIQLG
jgi:hypothetical protein